MFEGIIIDLIVFAVGYMRLTARRTDASYGDFILSQTSLRSERARPIVTTLSRFLSGAWAFARR